jgi:hypothetical protein
MTYREQRDARKEKMQQTHEAGLISERFPEVSNIVIDMQHDWKGIEWIHLLRTLNFSSESHAYFHVECLNRDCKECIQGFDLHQFIAAMIRSHTELREGSFTCEGNNLTSGRLNINYKVVIQYFGHLARIPPKTIG